MSREAFEKSYTVPNDAFFCEDRNSYVRKQYQNTRHPHNDLWCAFQDGHDAATDAQQARIDELEQALRELLEAYESIGGNPLDGVAEDARDALGIDQ